ADVTVTLLSGQSAYSVRSEASGYFVVRLPRRVRRGVPITIRFQHADYQPLEIRETADNKLYIGQLSPLPRPVDDSVLRDVRIGNVVAEYSVTSTSTVNIGSAVKTFTVPNSPNLPCNGARPCSPDGRWRAMIGSAVLDAGQGNEFHNARVS